MIYQKMKFGELAIYDNFGWTPSWSFKLSFHLYSLWVQVSGFRLTYDLSLPAMSRLVLAEVRCANCSLQWEPIQVGNSFQDGRKHI